METTAPQQLELVFDTMDADTRRKWLLKRKRELLAELRPINQELQTMDWQAWQQVDMQEDES